jgi:hypothetical protein
MDPYLEQHWGDVHTSLMVYIRNQFNAQLPDELQARVEESTGIQIEEERQKTVYPDVRIVEDQPTELPGGGGTAIATEPIVIAKPIIIQIEPRTQRTVEIVDISSGDRVVTAIEVLSPGNKIGRASRDAYQVKQKAYLQAGVNLVELDLVSQGAHIVAIPEELLPTKYRDRYMASVRRAIEPLQAEFYPMPIREALPDVSIPLRPADKDIRLGTQQLIDQCYQDGRYWRTDYTRQLPPEFLERDAAWVKELLSDYSR